MRTGWVLIWDPKVCVWDPKNYIAVLGSVVLGSSNNSGSKGFTSSSLQRCPPDWWQQLSCGILVYDVARSCEHHSQRRRFN